MQIFDIRSTAVVTTALLFTGAADTAFAQNKFETTGDCNQNISGNGNNVTVNCTIITNAKPESTAASAAPTDVEVAINFVGTNTIETWVVDGFGNWQNVIADATYVDFNRSSFELELDGEYYDYPLSGSFDGGFQELEIGRHGYSMTTEIIYYNGFTTKATCRGWLDIQSNATLVPKQHVQAQFRHGQIQPISCGFIASQ